MITSVGSNARIDRAVLLLNIRQLLTLRSAVDGARRGASLSELGIIEDAAVLCLGGKIVSVGTTKDALRDPWLKNNPKKVTEIDCAGRVVLPGFVDSHTHPVFTRPRLVDFEKRISGANYEEIAEAGGGIRSSIDGVRKASKTTLTQKVLAVLAIWPATEPRPSRPNPATASASNRNSSRLKPFARPRASGRGL